ncbi:MAG: tetratricopeptide repeat protein [Bacteroidetes bacterium]|nr:tetratricopeptide repeat protein [Bacteroidota bacterium]
MVAQIIRRFFLIQVLLILSGIAGAQNSKADSLLQAMSDAPTDSLQQQARLLYVQELRHNYQTAGKYVFEGLDIAKAGHDFYFLGQFYGAAGIMYAYIGNNDSSLICFQNSLNYRVFLKDTVGIASANLGISNIYRTMGDFKNAVKYGLEAEKAALQVADTSGLARIYNALGLIFKQQQDYDKALEYYGKSLEQVRRITDGTMESGVYSNIGSVYQEKKWYDSALVYHHLALNIRLKNQDYMGLGTSYGNLGLIFLDEQNFDSAFYYTNLALENFEKVHFTSGEEQCYSSLGYIWQKKGNHQKAILAYKKAEEYARKANFLPDLMGITKGLAISYLELKKYKEASDYLMKHLELKDSLEITQQLKEVQKLEMEFEYQQKQLADSLKLIEKEKLAALETEKQRQINEEQAARFRVYTGAGIAVLVLILSVVFILYRSNQKQKQFNEIIAEQKAVVEDKNKEITDSINYAKRIQEAILPPAALVEIHLPGSFIFYQPKDIVAGDFYWLESFAKASDSDGSSYAGASDSERGKYILVAAADCTGHGVPGAMVSVVCSNALNRTVKELGIKTPAKILDNVRTMVIETFEKSENEVKDGMDIALLSIRQDTAPGKWNVQFAGANNPVWISKKNTSEMLEIKGDSQPVGKFANLSPFTNHTLVLDSGDTLYIFTDGYADQFGGPKGKKFKAANLKSLLLGAKDTSMAAQHNLLANTLRDWKGNLEQVDDVCIIGIRL